LKVELWYTPTHCVDTEADVTTVLKRQLEATGLIEVEIKSAERATYVDNARNARMMLSLFGWYPDYIDPDDFLTPFLKLVQTSGQGKAVHLLFKARSPQHL
jgi:peptide/nickel transport system substrate-binding protein